MQGCSAGATLEELKKIWRLHNELGDDQLDYARVTARVLSVTSTTAEMRCTGW